MLPEGIPLFCGWHLVRVDPWAMALAPWALDRGHLFVEVADGAPERRLLLVTLDVLVVAPCVVVPLELSHGVGTGVGLGAPSLHTPARLSVLRPPQSTHKKVSRPGIPSE